MHDDNFSIVLILHILLKIIMFYLSMKDAVLKGFAKLADYVRSLSQKSDKLRVC